MDRSNSGQSDAVASQIQRMRRASRGDLVGKLGEKKHCYRSSNQKRMKRCRRNYQRKKGKEAVKRTKEQLFDSVNANTALDAAKTRGDF